MQSRRRLETMISEGNVKDLIAQFLYAASIINNDEHISEIKIGQLKGGLFPLKVTFGKEVRVETIG